MLGADKGVLTVVSDGAVMRIEADTETGNIAEQRSLEKAGFTSEGVSRSVTFRDGQWRDGMRYGVLRTDAGWSQAPSIRG